MEQLPPPGWLKLYLSAFTLLILAGVWDDITRGKYFWALGGLLTGVVLIAFVTAHYSIFVFEAVYPIAGGLLFVVVLWDVLAIREGCTEVDDDEEIEKKVVWKLVASTAVILFSLPCYYAGFLLTQVPEKIY